MQVKNAKLIIDSIDLSDAKEILQRLCSTKSSFGKQDSSMMSLSADATQAQAAINNVEPRKKAMEIIKLIAVTAPERAYAFFIHVVRNAETKEMLSVTEKYNTFKALLDVDTEAIMDFYDKYQSFSLGGNKKGYCDLIKAMKLTTAKLVLERIDITDAQKILKELITQPTKAIAVQDQSKALQIIKLISEAIDVQDQSKALQIIKLISEDNPENAYKLLIAAFPQAEKELRLESNVGDAQPVGEAVAPAIVSKVLDSVDNQRNI